MLDMSLVMSSISILALVVLLIVLIVMYGKLDDRLDSIELSLASPVPVTTTTEENGEKEAMSAAQRYSNYRKYRNHPNALMPSSKQPKEQLPIPPGITNERGDKNFGYLLANNSLNANAMEGLRSGATSIPGVGYDVSTSIPDTSNLPAETHSGVIETKDMDPSNFTTNPRVSPTVLAQGGSSFMTPNESGMERYRTNRRQYNL